jgi:ABC-type phosphate transport system substrate-binding protein
MELFHKTVVFALLLCSTSLQAQEAQLVLARAGRHELIQKSTRPSPQKIVIVTGARFSYKLVQKWIDDYYSVNPNVQIVIESRGSTNPLKFDVLAEVYEQDEEVRKSREYINVGRYAILPVATTNSAFARIYSDKGLNKEQIQQIFFHDIFADAEKQEKLKAPYTHLTLYTLACKKQVRQSSSRNISGTSKKILMARPSRGLMNTW